MCAGAGHADMGSLYDAPITCCVLLLAYLQCYCSAKCVNSAWTLGEECAMVSYSNFDALEIHAGLPAWPLWLAGAHVRNC